MALSPELEAAIAAAAARAQLPAAILRALVLAESGGDPAARSSAGAIGLTQLMPATAAELGVDPWEPSENLEGGAAYLAQQLRSFADDMAAALAAYNAGPGRVLRTNWPAPGWLTALPAETRRYVPKVLTLAGWTLAGERAFPPEPGAGFPGTSGPGIPGAAVAIAGLMLLGMIILAGSSSRS